MSGASVLLGRFICWDGGFITWKPWRAVSPLLLTCIPHFWGECALRAALSGLMWRKLRDGWDYYIMYYKQWLGGTLQSLFFWVRICTSVSARSTVDTSTMQVWTVRFPYTWIFFSISIVPVFSFYRSLNVLGKVWVPLENTLRRTTRTRIWVLILSKLFQLPALGWVIYQFLCFQGRENSMQIFHSLGRVAAFNPHLVQGSVVFTASSSGRGLPLDQQSRKVWPSRGDGWCGLWIYPGRVWTPTGLLIPPRGETWMWLMVLSESPSWLQVGRLQSLLSNVKESRVCLYSKYIAIFFFF